LAGGLFSLPVPDGLPVVLGPLFGLGDDFAIVFNFKLLNNILGYTFFTSIPQKYSILITNILHRHVANVLQITSASIRFYNYPFSTFTGTVTVYNSFAFKIINMFLNS
jgi:hypothetical protein